MTTTHRINTGVLVALALATTAAPASAKTFDLNSNGSYVPSGSPSMRSQATSHSTNIPPPVVRITAPNSGFDWADAGIGAAGGLALSMVGLGGALAVSQHRSRRTPTPQP